VESAVNHPASKRFAKKQLVLQMRTQVLDERLEATFRG
jgi:hypothetical protein